MQNLILGILILGIIILIYHFFFRKDAAPQLENDARRFARLLITEIKLYNDYKIQRGLKNNNLYELLKDEIEEARNKYKKRNSNAKFDAYFDDALIEILANGDKSKFGLVNTSINK